MKIKKNITLYFTSLLVLFFVTISCDVEDDNSKLIPLEPGTGVENPVTITQIIIANPELTVLESLLRRIEAAASTGADRLLTNLNTPGNSTVFAPTDSAFEAFFLANNITNVDNLDIAVVTSLVLNHVVAGEFLSNNLSSGYVSTLSTRGVGDNQVNLSMYVNTTDGVLLNGATRVVTPDVDANNGVIHIVDSVINLPSVASLITSNPDFSSLTQAVMHADTDATTPVVADALSNLEVSLTVFAPSNAAFTSLLQELDPTATSIQSVPSSQVAKILTLHVVSTNVNTAPISSNLFVDRTSMNLQTLLMGTAGRINFNGNTLTITDPRMRDSKIIPVLDIQGVNGVVHTLDKVLLPVVLE